MVFGWQGFTLEHPEDWAPVNLTGARHEGYARISSPGRVSLQVRWKASAKGSNLSSVLDNYLDRLRSDAKRAKCEFRSDVDESDGRLVYKYTSNVHGRGAILHSEPCGRVFFLETISTKNDSLLVTFRKLLDSFRSDGEGERWSLFGLDLMLPKGLEVEKKVLQAGRTQLVLTSKKARLEAQRWGFAEQLVAKHGLGPWAKSMLGLPDADMEESPEGISLTTPSGFMKKPTYALARIQTDRNQITTVKVSTGDAQWRPTWAWLA